MSAVNYTTKIVDHLRSSEYFGPFEKFNSVIPRFASCSQKFILPDDGEIFKTIKTTVLSGYISILRLPYEKVIIEVPFSINVHGQIGAAIFAEQNGESIDLFFVSMNSIDGPSVCDLLIKLNADFSAGIVSIQNNKQQSDARSMQFASWAVRVVLSLLAALSCKNVKECEIAPDARLQQKRLRNGKAPLYTYKTLVIGEKGQVARIGGSHSSPRVHLRRGHIRRLPDKNVWVNACVVGDKSKGIVHKDYAVTAR